MSRQLEQTYAAFMRGMYDSVDDAQAEKWVLSTHKRSATDQLSTYRGSVHAGLQKALADIYPAIINGLGEGNFRRLAMDYVNAHPSTSSNLDDYGAYLPAFINQHPALSELAYLKYVARLDWAWHRAFHAEDSAPLNAALLAEGLQQNMENMPLAVAPGCELITSDVPLYDIWRMNRNLIVEQQIDLQAGAQSCLVWRLGFEVCVGLADPVDQAIYSAFKKEARCGTKTPELLSKFDQEQVAAGLVKALSQQWLISHDKHA